jgi:predicted GH43/DUF377 family glycosyl hydrolase
VNQAFWDLWSMDHAANCARWQRLSSPAIAPSGSGWKKTWTANPQLMQFGDQSLLYYRGTGPVEGDPEERDQIGAAEVVQIGRRGIVIDDVADGPVIPSGGSSAFDADVLDPSAIAFKDEVLLYYSALGAQGDSIGLASSRDGITFTKQGCVMAGRAPAAILRSGKVWMLSQEMIGDGYGLKLFVSSDGRTFQSACGQPVFVPEKGSWDGLSVVTARLFENGEFVYMLYAGSADTVDEPAYFGLARSRDLVTWERHPGNPIFGAGARGAPDGGCIWFPALTETADSFVMLYEGSRGTPSWDLDCAICIAFVPK